MTCPICIERQSGGRVRYLVLEGTLELVQFSDWAAPIEDGGTSATDLSGPESIAVDPAESSDSIVE